jgi:hypothetical protein
MEKLKIDWFCMIMLIHSILVSKIGCITIDAEKDVQIVIVGGGAAGISALSRLLENGYRNVTLLEAQDYMGGRVKTIPFGSSVVDLGGQWVHGQEDNIVYEIVRKYNILDRTPYGWLGIGGKFVDCRILCQFLRLLSLHLIIRNRRILHFIKGRNRRRVWRIIRNFPIFDKKFGS